MRVRKACFRCVFSMDRANLRLQVSLLRLKPHQAQALVNLHGSHTLWCFDTTCGTPLATIQDSPGNRSKSNEVATIALGGPAAE